MSITKIIANRFAAILPQVIDEEQFGFVRGRQIHESIALAQELVGDIDRKIEGGNVLLKFDRLEWRFLLRAIRAMGFSDKVQDLVFRSIRFSNKILIWLKEEKKVLNKKLEILHKPTTDILLQLIIAPQTKAIIFF